MNAILAGLRVLKAAGLGIGIIGWAHSKDVMVIELDFLESHNVIMGLSALTKGWRMWFKVRI